MPRCCMVTGIKYIYIRAKPDEMKVEFSKLSGNSDGTLIAIHVFIHVLLMFFETPRDIQAKQKI